MSSRSHVNISNGIHRRVKAAANKVNQKIPGFYDSIVALGLARFEELQNSETSHSICQSTLKLKDNGKRPVDAKP